MTNQPSCGNCRYFVSYGQADGWCDVRPPVIVVNGGGKVDHMGGSIVGTQWYVLPPPLTGGVYSRQIVPD